jgi:hypothetical protein
MVSKMKKRNRREAPLTKEMRQFIEMINRKKNVTTNVQTRRLFRDRHIDKALYTGAANSALKSKAKVVRTQDVKRALRQMGTVGKAFKVSKSIRAALSKENGYIRSPRSRGNKKYRKKKST